MIVDGIGSAINESLSDVTCLQLSTDDEQCNTSFGCRFEKPLVKLALSKKLISGYRSNSSDHSVIRRLCLVPILLACTSVFAADWPPTLDRQNAATQSSDGRKIERYTHGARVEWGYPTTTQSEWQYPRAEDPTVQHPGPHKQNQNSFYVVFPRKPHKNAPLCVVLHSANSTSFDYLGMQFIDSYLRMQFVDSDNKPTTMMAVPDDCFALYLSSTNDEWWGWGPAHRINAKYSTSLTPTEKRVLDTIEWVIRRYKIDRNRVYLSGASMGGCGALGIGLPHGNIFAAILAVVPAGTEYAALRMGFPHSLAVPASKAERDLWTKQVSGFGLPDPPIVVDFSAENDIWSKTQPELLQAAQAGRLPLVLAWGPFGHTTIRTPVIKYPQADVALAFPWLAIRKNAAYPVFTNASSNQRPPWIGSSSDFDESGQMNAYFRWQDRKDKTSKFSVKLWMAHPAIENPPPVMPTTATTDITLRRLQSFRVQPGTSYTWELVRDGKLVASGKVAPDAANLLTIPHVTLSTVPAELSIKVAPKNELEVGQSSAI